MSTYVMSDIHGCYDDLRAIPEIIFFSDNDRVIYNIDCGCAYRSRFPEGKLACIRLDDEKIFYI